MTYFKLVFFLCLGLMLSGLSYVAEGEPEALAKEYFSVIQENGVAAVSRFLHPNALSEFKSMLLPAFEAEAEAGQNELMNVIFGSDGNISALREMTPRAFMDEFMGFVSGQLQSAQVRFDKIEVLGTVVEGKAHHVLARVTAGAGELAVTTFEVLSFIPDGDGWGLQLNGEFRGMASMFRSRAMGK